jgi:phosphate/sulfate permease
MAGLAALLVIVFARWVFIGFLWVLLGILATVVALFILSLPLRIRLMAQYDRDGPMVFAGLGPVRMKVYPRPEKRHKKPKKKKEKPKEEPETEPEVPPKGGTVQQLKAGLSLVEPTWRQIRRRLVISELTLHYTVATEDAAKTALLFGAAHAAVSQILPMIRQNFRVKKQDVQIRADFESGEDLVFVRVRLAISVWGAVCLGIGTLLKVKESGLLSKGAKHGQASHQ